MREGVSDNGTPPEGGRGPGVVLWGAWRAPPARAGGLPWLGLGLGLCLGGIHHLGLDAGDGDDAHDVVGRAAAGQVVDGLRDALDPRDGKGESR